MVRITKQYGFTKLQMNSNLYCFAISQIRKQFVIRTILLFVFICQPPTAYCQLSKIDSLLSLVKKDNATPTSPLRGDRGGLWQLRIGIHTGAVTAGVVGDKKFAYDIWGDTVNTASRMESSGEAGKINISGATYEQLTTPPQGGFPSLNKEGSKGWLQFTHRGKIPAKNKGKIDMYFIEKC